MVDYINRSRAEHIVTIEDPIEFLHKNQKSIIRQRELGSDTLSFSEA
jgi:twitching motility protein PilT